METKWKTASSLEKILFHNFDEVAEQTYGSMMKNEIYSFQLVGYMYDELEYGVDFKFEVESKLLPYIKIYNIDYVPNRLPTIEVEDDDDYITKEPGFFPDPLHINKDNIINIPNKNTRAVWITVEPNSEISGTFPINIKIFGKENELCAECVYTLKVIDACLPKQRLLNTGWFHGDCIATLHNVEIGSEKYYEIVEKYLDVYVKFGHNMIITPIFTPPLDTDEGGERPTNQLIGVKVLSDGYEFDFTKLEYWIDICQKHGIEKFEMAHLFTQWGAKHAPKIMAEKDGKQQRIFGWDTDSAGEEYTGFLEAMLPKLIEFLKEKGIFENCLFHISDEPNKDHQEQYGKARAVMTKFIPEEQMMDALGLYDFYEKGLVKKPVVSINHIHNFIDKGVKNLWAYYCMAQREDVSNRFLAMPSYRNRILGYQLYKYEIEGFLQWGFNFWFGVRSRCVIDPYIDTTANGGFPGGDAFVVYPLDADGEVVCSNRLYVFNEALQDLRALELLESLTDRETVLSLIEDVKDFRVYPRNNEYILSLREKVNKIIEERI